MKKFQRVLAVLMAFVMLTGIVSVTGSAYQAYKDEAILTANGGKGYNDIDAPMFTLEQYASIGLDEVDRMLAKEQLGELDIYVGTINLNSIDGALTSVVELFGNLESLLMFLGDAGGLSLNSINGVSRQTKTDVEVIYALFGFLNDNATIVQKYVNGTIDLGILNSLVASFVFDIRELVLGLLYELIHEDFDSDEQDLPENLSLDSILQDLLNDFVLGEWVLLNPYFDLPKTDGNHRDFEDYFEGTRDANKDYYGWFHDGHWVTYALGDTAVVDKGAADPGPQYSITNINSSTTAYDFIEALMLRAYNDLLVPELNSVTRPWLRQLCGVEYKSEKMDASSDQYEEDYDGEPYDPADLDPVLSTLFDVDGMHVPEASLSGTVTFYATTDAEGQIIYSETPTTINYNYTTFISAFNTTLGLFLDAVLAAPMGADTWTWHFGNGSIGDNSLLFKNICNVARYVLIVSGKTFFQETIETKTEAQIRAMSDQELVAYVMAAILNLSVDWTYVDYDSASIADAAYTCVEQLAWQDIPQYTYDKPERADYASDAAYYDALLDQILDILFDVAVYNLNASLDVIPAGRESGVSPANPVGNGLLQYNHDWKQSLLEIAVWAVNQYGGILNVEFNADNYAGELGSLTADDIFEDVDTLIDAIIPIVGTDSWIYGEISDSTGSVFEDLIFDYIIRPVMNLDATNFEKIFWRNENGTFANNTVKKVLIELVCNVINLILPNAVNANKYATLNDVLDNAELGNIAYTLLTTLYSRRVELVPVVLPVVCQLLGLVDASEFEEIEVYMPEVLAGQTTFAVYNGSTGVNTGYTDANGNFTQDDLYVYEISNAYVRTWAPGATTPGQVISASGIGEGTRINGGDSVNVTLSGQFNAGTIVEFIIEYDVIKENGQKLTSSPIANTAYAYVGTVDEDDDTLRTVDKTSVSGAEISYEAAVYLSKTDDRSGGGLGSIANKVIRIENTSGSDMAVSLVSGANSGTPAFVTTGEFEAATIANEASAYVTPYAIAIDPASENESEYTRYKETWEPVLDAEGNVMRDENDEIIYEFIEDNGGVEDGEYPLTAVISVGGTNVTINQTAHLYCDYNLGGLYDNAVRANRQQANYNMNLDGGYEAWAAYVAALQNAARLVLAPKVSSEFQATIAYNGSEDYANKFEQYYEELDAAIIALEEFAISSGVDKIKVALEDYSGFNYTVDPDTNVRTDLEYYEDGYIFFGMRDFVPHTYLNYRDARNFAEDLYNSQHVYAPVAPEVPAEDASPFEWQQYNEALEAYNIAYEAYLVALENIPSIGSVEAAYAEWKVQLLGSRLIRLPANKSKLEVVVDMCITNGNVNAGGASYYTTESWEAYEHARDFALEVNATSVDNLVPSQVNTATAALVEAWKDLVQGCNYTAVDEALANAADELATGGAPGSGAEIEYTEDTWNAFIEAYNAADTIDRNLAKTDENEAYIDEVADALEEAVANLTVYTGEVEIFYELTTDEVCFDMSGQYFWAPWFNESYYSDYYLDEEGNGRPYLCGISEYMFDTDYITVFGGEDALAAGNVQVVVEPSIWDNFATGATVKIVDINDESVVYDEWIAILWGDVNGDGEITGGDEFALSCYNGGFEEFWWFMDETQFFLEAAGDLNADGFPDAGDEFAVSAIVNGFAYFDQGAQALVEL